MLEFPEPKGLSILEIGSKQHEVNPNKYDVSNPHPGYGKDPNVINEYGHTMYPKWVDSKIEGKRIIVNSSMEEAQHTGENVQPPILPKSNPWTA